MSHREKPDYSPKMCDMTRLNYDTLSPFPSTQRPRRRSLRAVTTHKKIRHRRSRLGYRVTSVSHTQIIPVLVKSNQELHERLIDHGAQIADLEAAAASRDRQIDELRSQLSDIVSRLEAVESG